MPSANKDRIRVTLHVDRKIYALVKMWSEVEQKPISRLFDEVFLPHVERFEKYESFFDYQESEIERMMPDHVPDELLEEVEREEEESRKKQERISKMTKEEQEKHYQKFLKFVMHEEKRKQKADEEYNARWVKARSKMLKN